MTLFRHELRINAPSVAIWSGMICFMTLLAMLLYPEFKDQTATLSSMLAMMGPFTAALGLDKLDFTTAAGFYGIESGTMLSVGGALFAALTGIGMLAKEEGGRTAEFLLTLPISRARAVAEKLLALLTLLIGFNIICFAAGWLSFPLIGEPAPLDRFALFHLMQLLLHLEIGCICFGLSAFARRAQIGSGLGLALLLYFFSLIANMVESARFLRYITPFAYAEASDIFTGGQINAVYLAIGITLTIVGAGAAFWRYCTKDITA